VAAIKKLRLLLNYAGEDRGVNADVPAFLDAPGKASVRFEVFTYEGTQRGFDDETTPANYASDAAKLAWSRMIDFFRQTLR
jgi:carboxymethylenebutenolidase